MNIIEEQNRKLFSEFWLQPGDRVEHIKDSGIKGTIIKIDFDSYPFYEYGVTTCEVQWDDFINGGIS